jgi:hypothetical protein
MAATQSMAKAHVPDVKVDATASKAAPALQAIAMATGRW